MLLVLVSRKIVATPVRLVATLFVVTLFLAEEWRAQRPVVRVMVGFQMIWELESKAATFMLAPMLESFIGVPQFMFSGSCQLPTSHRPAAAGSFPRDSRMPHFCR